MKNRVKTSFLALGLAALAVLTAVKAEALTPWIGYGTVKLTEVNDFEKTMVVGATSTAEYFGNAPTAGFDFSFFRFAYLLPVPLQTQTLDMGQNVQLRSVTPSLASVMIGISMPSESSKSFLRLRAYGGYAYATVQTKHQSGLSVPSEATYEGSGTAAEASAALCLGNIEIGVNYRYTRISELGLTMDTDFNNNEIIESNEIKGTTLKDGGGVSALPFDFSGISVNIAIRFGGVETEE